MDNLKKALFIDRDGTIIAEPPVTFQVDNLQQLEFLPSVIRNLYLIRKHTDFEFVMVTNQDGLGTEVYPQENFDSVQEISKLADERMYQNKKDYYTTSCNDRRR